MVEENPTTIEPTNTAAAEGESSGEEITLEEYLLYSARHGEMEGLEECM